MAESLGPDGAAVWGQYSLEIGARSRWQIGPLSLWIRRAEAEWRVASLAGDDPLAMTVDYEAACSEPAPPQARRIRCAANSESRTVTLSPALADRPVVVRPEQPVTLQPGDEVVFYVGSQLWLRIDVGEPPRMLVELPTYRLSDTWFGPSTRVGELCYASKTNARTVLAEVPGRPARALTRVRLRNRGRDNLVLERLKMPVGNLALYIGADGHHWTSQLVVQRDEDGVAAEVHVDPSAPEEAGEVSLLAGPRIPTRGMFKRAMGALIS
ncbi:MAG: hypothetical protein R3A51_12855 [Nannocystaceae bacterium]|nr:hypothetical protein [Myxococcales bacterium]